MLSFKIIIETLSDSEKVNVYPFTSKKEIICTQRLFWKIIVKIRGCGKTRFRLTSKEKNQFL